jgi:hypothetical protein
MHEEEDSREDFCGVCAAVPLAIAGVAGAGAAGAGAAGATNPKNHSKTKLIMLWGGIGLSIISIIIVIIYLYTCKSCR